MDMEIKEIIRITGLLKKVNCQKFALISEIAKEMGVKKTALMQYIEDNPKLFRLNEVKDGKGNVKGLAVECAYQTAVENPWTDEWVEAKKKEWERKVFVSEMNYYGQHEFWYIGTDREDGWFRAGLWRNTPEKIQGLVDAGLVKEAESCYGGFGDCSHWKGLLLTSTVENALKDAGWELVFPE